MAELTKDHIDYIIKDLHYRGIVLEGFDDEIIDHICTKVEEQMHTGKKFIDAYEATLRSFGNTDGLRETQKQVIQIRTKSSLTACTVNFGGSGINTTLSPGLTSKMRV